MTGGRDHCDGIEAVTSGTISGHPTMAKTRMTVKAFASCPRRILNHWGPWSPVLSSLVPYLVRRCFASAEPRPRVGSAKLSRSATSRAAIVWKGIPAKETTIGCWENDGFMDEWSGEDGRGREWIGLAGGWAGPGRWQTGGEELLCGSEVGVGMEVERMCAMVGRRWT